MGTIPKGGGGSTYLNVRKGALAKKLGPDRYEESGGYDGVITGVRVLEGEFNGRPNWELQIGMMDPDTGEHVVISSTLAYHDKSVGVWASMMLKRLVSTENKLEKNTRVVVGVYGGGDNANCASLRLHGATDVLPGKGTLKDFDQAMKAIEYLKGRYGEWAAPATPEDDAPPPPPEPPYDDSNRSADDVDLPF